MRISDWSSDVCSSDLTPGDQPAGVEPKLLSKLTEKGFGQRRKMLRPSLKGIEGAVAAAEALGIDPTRRAETGSVRGRVALASAPGGQNQVCPVAGRDRGDNGLVPTQARRGNRGP